MKIPLYDREIDLGPNPSGLCRKRWLGHLSPEPETVAWIESLPTTGVFFDIGASMGTHAIRAALRGLEVHAFEPQSVLANELAGIITRNHLSVRVCEIALMDIPGQGVLGPGRSTHMYYSRKGGQVKATTVDLYAQTIVAPDFIKLDVDGNELDVLLGAHETLPKVKSLLVEIDPLAGSNTGIPAYLEGFGFKYDPAQVEACRIRGGKYDGTANWIFYR